MEKNHTDLYQKRRMAGEIALRSVIFILGDQWSDDAALLRESLETEGIVCISLPAEAVYAFCENADLRKGTVFLTDSPETGRMLAQLGAVYFGCVMPEHSAVGSNSACAEGSPAFEAECEDTWFEGAALVLEGFAGVDARYLEEWMLRAQGFPAVIAHTDRLLIREMTEADIPDLIRIRRQMEALPVEMAAPCLDEADKKERESGDADGFSKDGLRAYIQSAYRLQGYGLWSVLHQDRVIGCCGFAPWDESEKTMEEPVCCTRGQNVLCMEKNASQADDSEGMTRLSLELQYMLDASVHRQGFGTEMCRAALEYAFTRLDVEEVWVRIRKENLASQALAEKLGFCVGSN